MSAWGIVLIVLGVLLLICLCISVRIVRQATAVVVERLGKYRKTLDVGIHVILPFFDRTSKPISLKEIVADFKPQPVITKDNVTMQIDTVVYFQITDAKLFTYGVDQPIKAIENLTATTLRNIVGELELDETLTSRDTVNTKMRVILDEATDAWGIKINRVELKNILPPKDIQDAMDKQMKAERERREQILRAEGEKKSNILVAEGEKQAKILRAEAEKTASAFEGLFGWAKDEHTKSVFAGKQIEVMKSKVRGTHGHIGVGTNSVLRAKHFLESQGYKFDESTATYKNGKLNFIYLQDEIGGFAVHLVNK